MTDELVLMCVRVPIDGALRLVGVYFELMSKWGRVPDPRVLLAREALEDWMGTYERH